MGRAKQREMKMLKRIAITLAAVAAFSGAAHAADELPDYSDKTLWSCDKDGIESELQNLIDSSAAGQQMGVKFLYIKSSAEVSRSNDQLACKVVVVTSRITVTGMFQYKNQDGHALTGFKPK
jgi:hypothetical protein